VTVNHSRYHYESTDGHGNNGVKTEWRALATRQGRYSRYDVSGVQLKKGSTDPVTTADGIKAPFFWKDDFVLQTLSPTLLVVVASQNAKTIIQAYRLSAPFLESES
jgi:hypothetical protein